MAHLTSLQPYTLHPYVFENESWSGVKEIVYIILILYILFLWTLFHPLFALVQKRKRKNVRCKDVRSNGVPTNYLLFNELRVNR